MSGSPPMFSSHVPIGLALSIGQHKKLCWPCFRRFMSSKRYIPTQPSGVASSSCWSSPTFHRVKQTFVERGNLASSNSKSKTSWKCGLAERGWRCVRTILDSCSPP